MSDFATRIRRVRMKGGADVHVLHSASPNDTNGNDENYRGVIVRHAREIAGYQPDERMTGFIVLALWEGGGHSLGFRLEQGAMPMSLFPSYVAEVVRADTVTDKAARSAFHEEYEWVE